MKFVKKFEAFINEGGAAEPAVKPATPTTKPGTKPATKPSKPGPIPSKDPSTIPSPAKAEKGDKKKASAEEVAERFINLMAEEGEDIKKYTEFK